VFIVLLRVPL